MKYLFTLPIVLFMIIGLSFAQDGNNTTFDMVASNTSSSVDSMNQFARHIISGMDMDQDGKPEIVVTQYGNGGHVIIYEVQGDNTLEQVWESQNYGSSYGSAVRSLAAGKLDENDKTDLVVYVGSRTVNDSIAGLYIYEWDGVNDNGYQQVSWLYFAAYDSGYYRTEDIALADFDADGHNEVAFANWGSSSYKPSRSITIWSVTGTFSDGFYTWNREFKATREDMGAAGSLTGAFYGDIDNDGHPECWVGVYDKLSLAVIESDGADNYHIANYISQIDTIRDSYIIKGLVTGDMNGDESNELFVESTFTGKTFMVTAPTGSVDDSLLVQPAPFKLGPFTTMSLGDQDHGTGSDGLDLYSGGTSEGVIDYEYQSGPLTDTTSYTRTVIYSDSVGASWYVSVPSPVNDLDGDGNREVVSAWVGLADSIPQDWFRVIEFGQVTGINEWKVITPDNYVLKQNYPNPFNPTTTIEFFLPIKKEISLTIYNSIGQKVKTLINKTTMTNGTHSIQWDATNDAGQKVASGMYIYELKFGNFTKHKRMMLLK